MQNFVAYYRVSTDRQGKSGLGLDAQATAVSSFVESRGQVIETFTEIESGKKNDRPELKAALELCRKKKAKLVIAKLDRLARNVAFIANLMESGVDFVACDMPEANKLTLHIMAAFAEFEREAISNRTKDALAAAKARGIQLGNPRPTESLKRGVETRRKQCEERQRRVKPVIEELKAQGFSLRAIARNLNDRNILTPMAAQWDATGVKRVLSNVPQH